VSGSAKQQAPMSTKPAGGSNAKRGRVRVHRVVWHDVRRGRRRADGDPRRRASRRRRACRAPFEHGALEPARRTPAIWRPYAEALGEIASSANDRVLVATSGVVPSACASSSCSATSSTTAGVVPRSSPCMSTRTTARVASGTPRRSRVGAAREAGCYRIQLTSNVERTDAHRFYERLASSRVIGGSSCCWSRLQIERALLGEVVPVGRSCEGNHRVSNQKCFGNVSRAVHQRHIWPCG